jgi:hypothetical protein
MKISQFKITFLAGAIFIGVFTGCSNDSIEDLHPGIYDNTEPCDTANMTYDTHMKPLFITKCGADKTDCHKAPNVQDVNLDNFADARDLGMNGDITGAILHQPGFTAMPNDGTTLSQCNINKILAWVNRGCPEN